MTRGLFFGVVNVCVADFPLADLCGFGLAAVFDWFA